jgi:hypothetical protein
MEEKKLRVDIQKKDMSQHIQKVDNDKIDLKGIDQDNSRFLSDGTNENWYELRFIKAGPDRRGYHSSFQHNKKYYT